MEECRSDGTTLTRLEGTLMLRHLKSSGGEKDEVKPATHGWPGKHKSHHHGKKRVIKELEGELALHTIPGLYATVMIHVNRMC